MKTKAPQPVVAVPPPPPPSKSLLGIADGRPPVATNIGGIVKAPAASGTPEPVQAFAVPYGMYVRVRGHNGTSPGNAGNCYIAKTREGAISGPFDTIQPNTEIIFPVDNLGTIWVRTDHTGDGVTVSIRST